MNQSTNTTEHCLKKVLQNYLTHTIVDKEYIFWPSDAVPFFFSFNPILWLSCVFCSIRWECFKVLKLKLRHFHGNMTFFPHVNLTISQNSTQNSQAPQFTGTDESTLKPQAGSLSKCKAFLFGVVYPHTLDLNDIKLLNLQWEQFLPSLCRHRTQHLNAPRWWAANKLSPR